MKTRALFKKMKPTFLMFILLLIAVCLVTATCKKDDLLFEEDIPQPPSIHAPVDLPGPVVSIKKLEGEFTPLLMGVKCDWRIVSKRWYDNQPWGNCQSDPVTTTFKNKTISELKNVSVTYKNCQWNVGDVTYKPNFSAPINTYFAAYNGEGEQQDKNGTCVWHKDHSDIKYSRYFTVLDELPEAYIMNEEYWVSIPLPNGEPYKQGTLGEGGAPFVSVLYGTGFEETETKEWGYSVGATVGASADVVSAEVTTTFNETFGTSIAYSQYAETTYAEYGNVPEGKTAYRIQTFQRRAIFTLVNEDGSPYGETGKVVQPSIEIDLYTHNKFWYY